MGLQRSATKGALARAVKAGLLGGVGLHNGQKAEKASKLKK
jgi:hypothetical protein